MEFLKHLFRNEPDFFGSIVGTWYQIALIPTLIFFVFLTMYMCKKGMGERNLKIFAWVLLIEQIIENIWFWTAPYLADPLPLYHCRIAKIFLPLIVLFFPKVKGLKYFSVIIGIFGSIIAFLYPSMDPFAFPHFTNFGFYITHGLICIISVNIIVLEDLRLSRSIVWKTQGYMLCFNIIVCIIAHMRNENYAFFLQPPLMREFFESIGHYPYVVILFMCYALAVFLSAGLWKAINTWMERVNTDECTCNGSL